MTTELVAALAFTPDQVELLKNTICRGSTNDELALFMHVCKKTGLDPFQRQIYAIKRMQKGQPVMTIQVGIDGYRAIAERSGKYAPGKEPTFVYGEDKKLLSSTSYCHKLVGDKWFEVSDTAHYDEYVPKYWDGKEGKEKIVNELWLSKPHVMLSKCSEARLLRRCFPDQCAGTYIPEEMDQAGAAVVPILPKAYEIKKKDA